MTLTQHHQGLTARFVRDYAATPRQVWSAWTDPAQFKKWYGPQGYVGVVDHMDVRNGGIFRFGMRGPDGQVIWSRGVYDEVSPFDRLVYREHEDRDGDHEWHLTITLTFEATPKGTRMTMEQHGWPNKEWLAIANGAWTGAFEKLAEHLQP
ncbi:MAG TPA: SRPBCC domain-containing protein [Flavobacteriales bacterium]|nr:SRPBCC domain-containing protein [Flavobacteriales bacterium]